jgi:hypothetical protein
MFREIWVVINRSLMTSLTKDLYSSPNIVPVIKSRIRWAGHVARMGEKRGVYRMLVGKPEGKDHLGEPGLEGRIILRWSFRNWDVGLQTGSSWLRIGTSGGSCECVVTTVVVSTPKPPFCSASYG